MAFDRRVDDGVTPMGIAHTGLLTAREKIELLNQFKADATGFDAQTVLKGDF